MDVLPQKLVFTEEAGVEANKAGLADSVCEALKHLESSGFEVNLDGLTSESILELIESFYGQGVFTFYDNRNGEKTSLCTAVTLFLTQMRKSLNKSLDQEGEARHLSLEENNLYYRGAEVQRLRALLGLYILMIQSDEAGSTDIVDICNQFVEGKVSTKELFDRHSVEELGSFKHQLRNYLTIVSFSIRKSPEYRAGLKALAELALSKKEATPKT